MIFNYLWNDGILHFRIITEQNGAWDPPRDPLNQLQPFAGNPSKLRIRIFKSPSRLEFYALRRSKTRIQKFRNLQNGTFSGTDSRAPTSLNFPILRTGSILYSIFIFLQYELNGDLRYLKYTSDQNDVHNYLRFPNRVRRFLIGLSWNLFQS